MPTLFITFGIVIVDCDIKTFLVFWLPMYISKRFILDILYDNKRSATWNKIYETILSPILAFDVIKELIGFKKTLFEVSPKNSGDSKIKKEQIILGICHI
ncbi:hypothetical protein D3C71_1874280 [compost metagenome]